MKIEKLKNSAGVKFYPVTIPEAIANEETNELLPVTLAKKAEHGYESSPKTLKEVDDSVLSDEEVVATDLNTLAERVNALEEAFRNSVFNKVQTDSLDVLVNLNFQGRPLIIVSNVAPSVAPDGVPQFYINTATGDFYSAKASGSAGDWILI